jgi:GT2 family glycosyltransferase
MSPAPSNATRLLHVDLAVCNAEVGPSNEAVLIVFWWNGLPLGTQGYLPEELPLSRATLDQLAASFGATQIAARDRTIASPPRATHEGQARHYLSLDSGQFPENPLECLEAISQPAGNDANHLSVIVCTRDRLGHLKNCLDSLASQVAVPGEILIVDNSRLGSARTVCEDAGVAYLHEPRSGLSVARNAGIRASRGELLAFTDDDVEVLPGWSAEICRGLADPDISAVTGLVLPSSLNTSAQRYFQFAMGGFGTGCVPLLFGPQFFTETLPYGPQVWRIGAGANMAFRRADLELVGPFDERLGAGAEGCSEDSEMWYRLLAAGKTCLYEPRAVVLHQHRAEWSELKQQVRAYMRGHVAALFIQHYRYGHRGNLRRIFWQLPAYLLGTCIRSLLTGNWPRLGLLWEEFRGWLVGLGFIWRRGAQQE